MIITKNLNQKSQSFSTDIVVVVVIILFGGLLLVLNQIGTLEDSTNIDAKYELASEQSKLIFDKLREDDVIDNENQVDVGKILVLDDIELKEELGINSDFCITFEKDGKLVKIDPEKNINGVGSDKIIVNGVPCK